MAKELPLYTKVSEFFARGNGIEIEGSGDVWTAVSGPIAIRSAATKRLIVLQTRRPNVDSRYIVGVFPTDRLSLKVTGTSTPVNMRPLTLENADPEKIVLVEPSVAFNGLLRNYPSLRRGELQQILTDVRGATPDRPRDDRLYINTIALFTGGMVQAMRSNAPRS